MPVIAVELDDQTLLRQKRINAEFTADDMLWLIGRADRVENTIADRLGFRAVSALLSGVQLDQHCMAIGISITARQRAIQYSLCFARWRPSEPAPTNLTGVAIFIATLPEDLMIKATKVMFGLAQPVFRQVKRHAAQTAWNLLAGFALRMQRFIRADRRTKALLLLESSSYFLATSGTYERSDFTHGFHMLNYSICAATVKPIALACNIGDDTL